MNTTILNFRCLLEKHELSAGILVVINGNLGDRHQGSIVDVTRINAPSSTKKLGWQARPANASTEERGTNITSA
jgi:IS5 family transposase